MRYPIWVRFLTDWESYCDGREIQSDVKWTCGGNQAAWAAWLAGSTIEAEVYL